MHSERALPRWLTTLAAAASALWIGPGAATEAAVPEHHMKAAFVYNFAVFTQWPAETLAGGGPLSVCASADTALYAALKQLTDKPINGHPVALRGTAGSLHDCHVLVLERGDRERWPQWKRAVAGSPVLTVADDRVIGDDGAIIALSNDNQRISFDIDMAAVRGARLALSSKLLRLARSVQ